MRVSNQALFGGGGSLSLGFNIWQWTVRGELAFHSHLLALQSQRLILLVRPSFWVGYRVPLGRFEVAPLLGVTSELFVSEQPKAYKTWLEWGGMLGVQGHLTLTGRWSLFARAALMLFPGGFANERKEVASPSFQLGLQLGLQVRL